MQRIHQGQFMQVSGWTIQQVPALHPWRFGTLASVPWQAVVLPHDLNFYPPHSRLVEILPPGEPHLKSVPVYFEETPTGETLMV